METMDVETKNREVDEGAITGRLAGRGNGGQTDGLNASSENSSFEGSPQVENLCYGWECGSERLGENGHVATIATNARSRIATRGPETVR